MRDVAAEINRTRGERGFLAEIDVKSREDADRRFQRIALR